MDEDIKKEIKNFIVLSNQDDHSATNASLQKIVKAKVDQRYQTALSKVSES